MNVSYTKMHGAGNDFVVIDLISQRCKLRPRDIRKLADRRFGVGCDQVLVLRRAARPEANPDAAAEDPPGRRQQDGHRANA